jgi:hypothetical protein
MKISDARKIKSETIVMTFGVIFAFCLLAACNAGTHKTTGGGDRVEEARVTSPDGRFDAVMTREPVGGVLGGVYWNVFIVPKDAAAPKDDNDTIVDADVLRGEKLVWKQNHLLEIHYDIAHIERFRNLWGSNEVHGRGWRRGDYLAEVRLVPSSPDFSFVTPDGDFKPTAGGAALKQ